MVIQWEKMSLSMVLSMKYGKQIITELEYYLN